MLPDIPQRHSRGRSSRSLSSIATSENRSTFFDTGGAFVGRLHQIGNLIIRVYANDHLPPHFHVVAPDFEALIDIETLSILRGSLPRPARDAVLEWTRGNRAAIAAEWNRTNPRLPIA